MLSGDEHPSAYALMDENGTWEDRFILVDFVRFLDGAANESNCWSRFNNVPMKFPVH